MPINFESALGINEDALILRTQRAEVLANNIANADTPNYKARDIDFRAALSGAKNSMQLKQNITHAGHQTQLLIPNHSQTLMYRESIQPSIDGNTVDLQQEMARYTENSIQFQGSFQILNSSFKGLAKAIKGE
jgi:flagellar basal-body rod protein FlgB